jgi:CubicO group peptidase (beta-lactamase class C family)
VKSAHGDPELAAELAALASRRTRSVAAAVIDIETESRPRFAFIGADPDTRFEIGSVTKGLTGMLLADTVDRGEMLLDTNVSAISPRCEGTTFGSVTMKELCTNTSGLPRVAWSPLSSARALSNVLLARDPYRGQSGSELLDVAARQPIRHRGQPRYSNLGAAVLGHLVATEAGIDYSSLLRERILLPTGMSASSVASRSDTASRGWSSTGRREQPWIMDAYAPAGAVISTITDMSRLATSLLDGSAPGHKSLVAFEGVETDRSNRATGMFWIIDKASGVDRTMIWHNGQTGGHSAFFALFPQTNRAVVVLANVARAPEQQRIALALLRSTPAP